MHRLSGFAAVCALLVTGISAASCSSDNGTTPPTGTGGSSGTGGGGQGGADASTAGSGNSPDSGTGGTSGDAGPSEDAGPQPDPALCGNGQLDPYEDCDDGNKKTRDGCENSCRWTCTSTRDSLCQDGDYCNGREVCNENHTCGASPGPLPDDTRCGVANVCKSGVCVPAAAICGDTLLVDPEECDPPNVAAGCDADCRFTCKGDDPTRNCVSPDPCAAPAKCNDLTHLCELKGTPRKDYDSCTYGTGTNKRCIAGVCTDKYCSNSIPETASGEECDDGNRQDGDGCDADCTYSCLTTDSTRNCHATNACMNDGTCQANHTCTTQTPKTKGTACGTKQNCVEGNCVAPVCGDGIVAAGVEACDDGNVTNGDGCDNDCTKSCVNPLTDCPNTPACRTAVCTNDKCDSTPDASKDGQTCSTGGGTAKCAQGACTNGTCGNGGAPETGEQCDDGNLTPGDGCEPNCTFTCAKDADCNDGDPCNGAETCNTTTHKCNDPADQSNGTSCGSNKICVSGGCRPAICGDGVVSGSEGCDPPNTLGCDDKCKPRAICNLTGSWALKVVVPVTWGDGAALVESTGVIKQWARLKFTQTGLTFTADLKPCGLQIPDFQTTPTLGSEWYGLLFPDTSWDAGPMPTFAVSGSVDSQLIGAKFDTFSVAILLGTKITAPADPISTGWPQDATNLSPFTLFDSDNDAKPGFTVNAKSGPVPGQPANTDYKNIIVAASDPAHLENATRADSMYLAIRQIAAQTGTVTSCDTITGTATAQIENHIIGCNVAGENRLCTSDEWGLPDAVRPQYDTSAGGATFDAKRLGTTTTCTAVRSALP
ncbi:MAG TPA: DUF4215 domain-containing protein [Polyangiaceae bacterium]|nr:DUF4215 domain-containing protein [Polyangiaceae bacterium]